MMLVYNVNLGTVLDKYAPQKRLCVTVRPNTQWYNNNIAKAKLCRRQLERKWRVTKLEIQMYVTQRQIVQSLIKEAKSLHHSSQVEECGKDAKQLFKVVNKLLNRNKASPLPEHQSCRDLANQFSQYFVNKILNIRANLPVIKLNQDMFDVAPSLCSFHPVTLSEVESVIMKSPNKSCELDPLPTHFVKKILPAIVHIVNASIESGVIPQVLKTAVIRPTLKKPNLDKESIQNYRPISNLSFLSKVLERLVFSCLLMYMQEKNLLDKHQSAYRPHHSAETLLTNLTDHILKQMDDGNITAAVLLDMSSAFDTVEHDILIQRLQSVGIRGLALYWFKSYLSNRSQCVRVNEVTSDPTILTCGVLQGSVGGPLLFLCISNLLVKNFVNTILVITVMRMTFNCLFHFPHLPIPFLAQSQDLNLVLMMLKCGWKVMA